jgi:hypothetical protein
LPLAADPGFFLAGRADAKRAARLRPGDRPRRVWRRRQFAETGS